VPQDHLAPLSIKKLGVFRDILASLNLRFS
jgi:hypothetical protein